MEVGGQAGSTGTEDRDASRGATAIPEGPWASWGTAGDSLSRQVSIPGVWALKGLSLTYPYLPQASPSLKECFTQS